MAFNRPTSKRASGYGYYTTYSSDADDVLDFVTGQLTGIDEDKPYYGYDGKTFKVTVIVEEE